MIIKLTSEIFHNGKLIESKTIECPIINNGVNSTTDLSLIINKKGKEMKENKRLTKIRALEICEELWAWLAKTGKACKEDWPGWKIYGEMVNNCPCCEYSSLKLSAILLFLQCDHCPIKWTYKKEWIENTQCVCEHLETSPYAIWRDAKTTKERKAAAEKMLVLIRKNLKHERSK